MFFLYNEFCILTLKQGKLWEFYIVILIGPRRIEAAIFESQLNKVRTLQVRYRYRDVCMLSTKKRRYTVKDAVFIRIICMASKTWSEGNNGRIFKCWKFIISEEGYFHQYLKCFFFSFFNVILTNKVSKSFYISVQVRIIALLRIRHFWQNLLKLWKKVYVK